MPTLTRFLTMIAIVCAVVYAAMFALATFVEPRRSEMTAPIAPEKLNPPP